jgi:hypothetical protein
MINLSTQFRNFTSYYSDDFNIVVPLEDENIQANEGLAIFQEAAIKIQSGVYDPIGIFYSLGNASATVISPDGLVLTAAHCVSFDIEAESINDPDIKYVYDLAKKNGYSYKATILSKNSNGDLIPNEYRLEVLKTNIDDDIALCRLITDDTDKNFQFIGINEWGNDFNDNLFTLSHPSGCESAVLASGESFDLSLHRLKEKARANKIKSNFKVESIETLTNTSSEPILSQKDVLALKAFVAPGSSGGTVLNKFGDLVGVITHGGYYSVIDHKLLEDETVMTIATKSQRILDFLKKSLTAKQYQSLLDASKVFV